MIKFNQSFYARLWDSTSLSVSFPNPQNLHNINDLQAAYEDGKTIYSSACSCSLAF